MPDETLSNLSHETRRFEPPADLAAQANVTAEAYERADADREAFWAEQAERLDWDQKWDRVLDWDDPPFAKWFVGGRINAAYNCVDRHVGQRPGRQGRDPLGRRARGRHPRRSPTPTSRTRSARRPTRSSSSGCRPATGSRSTCR